MARAVVVAGLRSDDHHGQMHSSVAAILYSFKGKALEQYHVETFGAKQLHLLQGAFLQSGSRNPYNCHSCHKWWKVLTKQQVVLVAVSHTFKTSKVAVWSPPSIRRSWMRPDFRYIWLGRFVKIRIRRDIAFCCQEKLSAGWRLHLLLDSITASILWWLKKHSTSDHFGPAPCGHGWPRSGAAPR